MDGRLDRGDEDGWGAVKGRRRIELRMFTDGTFFDSWGFCSWGFPGGLVVKNPPSMQEMQETPGFNPWVRKIPLEEGMATCSSILAWRIPWTEEPGGLHCTGSQSQTRLSDLARTHVSVPVSGTVWIVGAKGNLVEGQAFGVAAGGH